jgi:hypothetical protein
MTALLLGIESHWGRNGLTIALIFGGIMGTL